MLIVDPLAHDGAGDIRFVLVIAGNNFDLAAGYSAADLLGRHLRGNHRTRPVAVFILAAHVGDNANAQHFVLRAGGRRRQSERAQKRARNHCCCSHLLP
jgi:hypothetical protein